jgi:hypothetical protein
LAAFAANQLRSGSVFVRSGAFAALCLAVVDLLLRATRAESPTTFGWWLAADVALFLVVGIAAALAAWLACVPILLARSLAKPRVRKLRGALEATYLTGILFVVLRAAAVAPLLDRTPLQGGTLVLTLLGVGSALAGAFGAIVLPAALRRAAHRARGLTALSVSAALVMGAGALALDMTVLVSLYERAHLVLEGTACLFWGFACALVCAFLGRTSARLRRATYALDALLLLGFALFCAWPSARRGIEAALPYFSERPPYAGRTLRATRQIDALWRGDVGSELSAGLQRLADRYELHDTVIDESWTHPVADTALDVLTPTPLDQDWNIVVFFVDALRNDVAADRAVMPNLAQWDVNATSFSRAYSSGSSTLLALPQMLGCRYDATPKHAPMLLDLAEAHGMRTALFIPTSASEYHTSYYPSFAFQHRDIVSDYDKERRPTAGEIVHRALSWLRAEKPARFLLWLYQFDVHSWADLRSSYVDDIATRWGYSKTNGLSWRYRAAVRGVDDSFARLTSGLEELGLASRTIVLFVADHGEALGQEGFWIHTTYLWESLVRVPLALHVPGLPGRRIEAPVSIVDVVPTIARFISPRPLVESCHGRDVLATEPSAPRRLPILFSAIADGQIVRVGQIGDADRKIVVDLAAGHAQLLRVDVHVAQHEQDISDSEQGALEPMLNQLVRSPIFPRSARMRSSE